MHHFDQRDTESSIDLLPMVYCAKQQSKSQHLESECFTQKENPITGVREFQKTTTFVSREKAAPKKGK